GPAARCRGRLARLGPALEPRAGVVERVDLSGLGRGDDLGAGCAVQVRERETAREAGTVGAHGESRHRRAVHPPRPDPAVGAGRDDLEHAVAVEVAERRTPADIVESGGATPRPAGQRRPEAVVAGDPSARDADEDPDPVTAT